MNPTFYDEHLFTEFFGWQPQAFIWLAPVRDANTDTITDFIYTYSNEEGLRYLNLKPAQLGTIRISDTPPLTDEMRTRILEEMIQVYTTGTTSITHIYNPVIDKHAKVSRIKFRNGILTSIQDATDEVKAIQELKERTEEVKQQRELSNRILDASMNGVLALEAIRNAEGQIVDFRFLKVNRMCMDLMHMSEEAILSQSYLTLLPPSRNNGLFDLKCKVVETGQPAQTEVYYEGAGIDGWYQISIVRLGTNGIVETFTNITESKRTKEQVESAADRFRTVANTSQAGMFTLTPVKDEQGEITDFRFTMVNQAVASYIGQTAEVLMNALASIYFPAYKTNGLFNIYKDTLLTGQPYNFDFHYEDGYDVYFNIDVVRMGQEVLVTFTDHTTLKRLQRELESKVEELKRSNANLEEFAYAASHDLQEPLRKVRYFSERLKNDLAQALTDENHRMLDRMESAIVRMKVLIDGLLAYSRASAAPTVWQPVPLQELVQQVVQDFEATVNETGALIDVSDLPLIQGDERQLRQLFQNLISNAIKYRKPGVVPKVSIIAYKPGAQMDRLPPLKEGQLLIQVSDNGIGFEQEYAEKIFQVFQRLHGRSEYEGTGVGLAIAQKVATNHNGYIYAQSEPGKGATFNVILNA